MERIHFENRRDGKMIVIQIIAFIGLIAGIYEVIEFDKIGLYFIIGLSFQVLYLSKMFWYKNYVLWSEKGGVIRIKSFFGESLNASEIRSSELKDRIMTIIKIDGEQIMIDLNHVQEEDGQRLKSMIQDTIA